MNQSANPATVYKVDPGTYRICVATHLTSAGQLAGDIVSVNLSHTLAGQPVTVFVVNVRDQGELMGVIAELHAAQLTILRMDQVCSA